jgi:Holliday junction resolvase RusA-like endonuclease
MDLFTFTHFEDPVVKGRPRFSKWGAYTPKKTLDAEKRLRETAIEAGIPKFEVPVEMSLIFYTKTKRRSDASNLAKLVEDALNNVAYSDDYLIESLHVRVFRALSGEVPRSEVMIKEL